ncbi:unnamed protein product [Hymenolepis diminuta]|uniref:Uncharacterized protein n=1 Tax=Hymenolepis diminuta TaxID=6216 RepID=A0A564YLY5_HYMDI|nr:unnamed protein product [Hymenolepis diminuta]
MSFHVMSCTLRTNSGGVSESEQSRALIMLFSLARGDKFISTLFIQLSNFKKERCGDF